MSNPLGQVIPKSNGRRFVISDIHGCHQTLEALIAKLALTPEDNLIFLGDYVNKGPRSRATLDYLINLSEQFTIHACLGNHDLILLDYLSNLSCEGKNQLIELNNEEFFDICPSEQSKYVDFLSNLYHYFISEDFILVHAGLNFNLSNPFLGREEMLNTREFYYDSSKAQNKTIVHGHYPHTKGDIVDCIQGRNKIIPLDNGCVYSGERAGMGELLCLELDTMSIHSQLNSD